MPVVGQEFNEFCQACDIGRESFLTAVGHEHDAIDTVEQLYRIDGISDSKWHPVG